MSLNILEDVLLFVLISMLIQINNIALNVSVLFGISTCRYNF